MNERKEVSEAITAGRQALSILRMAKDELRSAGNWGVVDMVGGGFFSGMMKHSKINHASSYMRMAKEKLLIFQRELKDVYISTDMEIEISDFLTFADFFLDGLITDYLVHSKIEAAKSQIEQAMRQVERIVYRLEHSEQK